jgi:asparagine synthase (glutamine-hydrolysing)
VCSISGIYDRSKPIDRAAVERMVEVLRHRGPDDSGVLAEGPVVLGNTRLAILDLSADGHQPMEDLGGRYAITYNGEIYNYVELRAELEARGERFRSRTDTEVLLRAYAVWGEEALQRLNGMFAFAIWDRESQELFAARDRLGVKPFVYAWDGTRLAFASEHKALLAAGLISREPSAEAIYEFIVRGYTTAGRSFYADVRALPPGHSLRAGPDGLRVREWWQPSTEPDEERSVEAWAEEIGVLLDDAVRLRLRSDVPVGVNLSGGLDSSAVAAAAARNAQTEILTFTGAFPSARGGDERRYARAVAARYGLDVREVEIDVDELAVELPRILYFLDEPIAGPGVFPQLKVSELAASTGTKVVLGGQGGDELFGGYLRHRARHHLSALRHGRPLERAVAGAELVHLTLREGRRVRRTATKVGDEQLAPSLLAALDADFRRDVRRPRLQFGSAAELMLWDLRTYLPALLHLDDRTSMAVSIEGRTPLLDYRLVELVLRVPERHKFGVGRPKPLLRRAVRDWLPREVVDRRDKRGFPTPLQQWKSRPALRGVVDALATGDAVFSKDYLARRQSFQPSELWTVLMVQGWLAQLDGSLPDVARAA